ncbi:HK97-gp10 family putative phage morphogenesis protein [Paenibacillus illinoisensis]|uniref:HK97-gp10 family putative phage morphogenesis protein n=1 Tax=Paenibacillus illinoisensis TaxID=59845 RepID=UPI000FDAC47D|nr:HK97-gp10 family putative phage morphogenesis protein [Paenibacillus illinoisensis]
MAMQGVDRLMRKLARLGADKEALKRGIHKATLKVQGDAKALAPTGETGQLRNSIKAEVTEERGKTVGVVSTGLDYAPYVEFGTGQRGKDSPSPPKYDGDLSYRQDWKGMPAQPFLYPAAEQNKQIVSDMIADELKKEIRKLGGH